MFKFLKRKPKKLRLLVTEKCNKSCKGCCNKDWDLENLPICTTFRGYQEVLITGGEPTLVPDLVKFICRKIRKQNKKAKIYVYTAAPENASVLFDLLRLDLIDGMTVTLHNQTDASRFVTTMDVFGSVFHSKSFRLNVFKGIHLNGLTCLNNWTVRPSVEWIKDCPLPEGETFMRYIKP